jgi:hypothetical protein
VPAPAPRTRYRERLTPPWWGWLLGALWASTLGIAYGYAISTLVGWLVFAGLCAVAAAGLWAMSAVVEVVVDGDDAVLRAGRASLPLAVVATVTPLDADRARLARGTEADPTAYTLLRGWVREAVKVELDDRTDPTPYWYVSTRRPAALADAIVPVDVTGSGASDQPRGG